MAALWRALANQPHLLLVVTMLAWGGNTVAGKLAVGHVSPMMLTMGRWSVAIIFIWALSWREVRTDWPVIRKRLPYLTLMGMVGFTLFNALFYTASNFTSAINMAIEQAAIPLFIFIGNLMFFRIAATARQVIGFAVSVIGVIITVTHGNPLRLLDSGLNFGDFLMLVAVIIYAGYSILLRNKPDIHWKSLFTMIVTSAFLTSIPMAVWEIAHGTVIYPVTLQGIGVVLYAAILPSIISQIFFILAVEKLGANLSGLYINLVPIFGTLLSVAILDEPFGWHHAVALALVTGGIVFAQTGQKKS